MLKVSESETPTAEDDNIQELYARARKAFEIVEGTTQQGFPMRSQSHAMSQVVSILCVTRRGCGGTPGTIRHCLTGFSIERF